MDDLISRQATIDAFKKELTVEESKGNLAISSYVTICSAVSYEGAKHILESLPSAQQWIPCSERLPEDDTEVFVYLFDRPSPYVAWVCDGCWFTEEFQVEEENYPKAWMPLPEPYKG